MSKYVKAGEAERQLGVDRRTLKRWASKGFIKCIQPDGKGQRLYDLSSVVGDAESESTPTVAKLAKGSQLVDVIYARVSTRKQLSDLRTQIATLESKYPGHTVFSDIASGLNFKRKGLQAVLELAFERRLRVVRLAHRDRLCRFAWDLLQFVLEKHGAKVTVEEHDELATPEHELAEDVLSVVTVFGARLHGRRSGAHRRKQARQDVRKAGDDPTTSEPADDDRADAQAERAGEASGADRGPSSDLQGSDGPDAGAGEGAEALLLGGEAGVQRDGSPSAKRRKA